MPGIGSKKIPLDTEEISPPKAAENCAGIHDQREFLCCLLRGDRPDWPPPTNNDFYSGLLEQCAYHGVDALVHHLIKDHENSASIPPRVRDRLGRRSKQLAAIELARAHDQTGLRNLLAESGIRAVLMKGGALAYTHYPAPYLRTRVDTDIFISLRDIGKIRELFERSGYRLEGWIYKSHQFKAMKSGFGGQVIKYDVHWRSSNNAAYARVLAHDSVLEEAVPIPQLDGFNALSPRHALLQACLHRAANPNHDADRLIWIYDLHLILNRMTEVETLEFANLAVRFNIQAICLESIEKASQNFKTKVPQSALSVLRTPVPARTPAGAYTGSQLALMMDDLRLLRGGRNRLDYVREFLFPPADYLLRRYGKTGHHWTPVLYCRYWFGGVLEKITLR